ncbi:DUF6216 family protein [Pseudomonas sp. EpS/L25]|uniref:DUF6216 family protein n=1 Tax=Pseudomonas sp. EpS/L25 TaxID=1749078 RepID=UPI000A5F9636|nr:DUF6216 family protein [Pseudomonas sp. EpS/L25]
MLVQILTDVTTNLLSEKLKDYAYIALLITTLALSGWNFYKRKIQDPLKEPTRKTSIKAPVNFDYPELQELQKRESTLKDFRKQFRFNIGGLDQSRRFSRWLIENDIPARIARSSINHIDTESLIIKTKNIETKNNWCFAASILLLTALTLTLSLIPYRYVIASFPNSPTFHLSEQEAKLGFFTLDTLNIENCRNPEEVKRQSQAHHFPIAEAQVICSALTDNGAKKWVEKNIIEQRIAILILSITFALPLYELFTGVARLSAARVIEEKIKKNIGKPTAKN